MTVWHRLGFDCADPTGMALQVNAGCRFVDAKRIPLVAQVSRQIADVVVGSFYCDPAFIVVDGGQQLRQHADRIDRHVSEMARMQVAVGRDDRDYLVHRLQYFHPSACDDHGIIEVVEAVCQRLADPGAAAVMRILLSS